MQTNANKQKFNANTQTTNINECKQTKKIQKNANKCKQTNTNKCKQTKQQKC